MFAAKRASVHPERQRGCWCDERRAVVAEDADSGVFVGERRSIGIGHDRGAEKEHFVVVHDLSVDDFVVHRLEIGAVVVVIVAGCENGQCQSEKKEFFHHGL